MFSWYGCVDVCECVMCVTIVFFKGMEGRRFCVCVCFSRFWWCNNFQAFLLSVAPPPSLLLLFCF